MVVTVQSGRLVHAFLLACDARANTSACSTAALASVPFGYVSVRVRVQVGVERRKKRMRLFICRDDSRKVLCNWLMPPLCSSQGRCWTFFPQRCLRRALVEILCASLRIPALQGLCESSTEDRRNRPAKCEGQQKNSEVQGRPPNWLCS